MNVNVTNPSFQVIKFCKSITLCIAQMRGKNRGGNAKKAPYPLIRDNYL